LEVFFATSFLEVFTDFAFDFSFGDGLALFFDLDLPLAFARLFWSDLRLREYNLLRSSSQSRQELGL
jgi:hypothetical protein